MHSTSNLKDGYLGSGTKLRRAIRKYGKENFRCEILEFFSTREDLVKREKELVNEDLIKDSNCMNLKPGGHGGFSKEWVLRGNILANTKRKALLEKDEAFKAKFSNAVRVGLKKAYTEGRKDKKFGGWNRGKKLTAEHKEKIGRSNSEKQKGYKNSQFGIKFRWINNGVRNAKHTDIEIPEGWRLGKLPIKRKGKLTV